MTAIPMGLAGSSASSDTSGTAIASGDTQPPSPKSS